MLHPLSIGSCGCVPKSTLKSLQIASEGFMFKAVIPDVDTELKASIGGGGQPYIYSKIDQQIMEEDKLILELIMTIM